MINKSKAAADASNKKIRTLFKTLQLAGGTLLSVVLLSGCVYGVNKAQVTHGPIKPIHDKREGVIGVKPFTDERVGDRQKIGEVRNILHRVGSVELKGEDHLEYLFTGFVVETLKEVGYQAVILESSNTRTDASATGKDAMVLEGQITKFWVETLVSARSEVEVVLKLRDAQNGGVLWTASIYGHGEGTLWMGASSEFEEIIRQAVDQALSRAATEFVSDAFYNKVQLK